MRLLACTCAPFGQGLIYELLYFCYQAIKSYNDSIAVQSEWKQFHHICYWELMWCYT